MHLFNNEGKGCCLLVYVVTGGFILFDFVTGFICAIAKKTFNSSVMREGLYHKCGSILLVAFGILVDYAQTFIDLGVSVPVALSICGYIVIMEIGSIIENIGQMNPDIVPNKIKAYFKKLSE